MKFGLNVRQVEEIVRKRAEKRAPKKKPRVLLPPELEDVERQFGEKFATRVNIEKTREGGKVVIHYYSDEQLNYIYDQIVAEQTAESAE
jgi:ParB family chromosome partitioning protein